MSINLKDYKKQLNEAKKELSKVGSLVDKATKTAVLAVNALRMQRIFADGLDSSGSKIGSYNSTKPVYIDVDKAPKQGNHIGRLGKPIKSLYYDSYKDFRKAMGRESEFVNIRLTNELQNDLANGSISKSINKVSAFNPTKIGKSNYKVSLKKQVNIDKIEGLEKKYGQILNHTKKEMEIYQDVFNKELQIALSQLI